MKTHKTLFNALLAVVFLLSCMAWKPADAAEQGIVRYVKPGGTLAGDCTTWDLACDLQTAIKVSLSGDQIWVAQGVYYPSKTGDRGESFGLKNGVPVYGGFAGDEWNIHERDWDTNITVLSGDIGTQGDPNDNSYQVVTGSGASIPFDGFTITGGNANGETEQTNKGGGMYLINSSTGIRNVIFEGNKAASGGGLYMQSGSPTMTNVEFLDNSASFGGGIYNQGGSPTLTHVIFSGNNADSGGGMHNTRYNTTLGFVTLEDVTFSDNHADTNGGGMYNSENSGVTLLNVSFSANSAGSVGGGMFNNASNPIVTNATFNSNTANYAGGMYLYNNLNAMLTNVTLSGNTATAFGGGMTVEVDDTNTYLTNATFTGNHAGTQGGGIYKLGGNLSIVNSILWDNSAGLNNDPGLGPEIFGLAEVSTSIVEGGYATGTDIITKDPELLHLQYDGGLTMTHPLPQTSPAVDVGLPTGCPLTDQRGYPRPYDGDDDGDAVCDMGAYEWQRFFVYMPVITK